jgi:spore germination protein GerM
MTRRAILGAAAFVLAAALLWWLLFSVGPRWFRGAPATPSTAAAGPAASATDPQRRITATLFYVSEDGMALVPAQREVPFAEPVVEQARQVVLAQIAPVEAPLASAIPAGTSLRAIYLSDKGDLFVDLSPELTSGHPGGALEELFTVYSLVNALTVTLQAITRVQILVDGKEVDTLGGHVDLRNPLSKNLAWVTADNPS